MNTSGVWSSERAQDKLANSYGGGVGDDDDGPSHWKSLPESVHATTDPRSFKKSLKIYYLNLCFNYFLFRTTWKDEKDARPSVC